jgi:F-type H+-transporting ATPase subunit delta
MINKEIAKKYAQALFNAIKPIGNYEQISNQLLLIKNFFDSEKEIFNYLINPINEQTHKIQIADKILQHLNIDNFVQNFIHVLIKKNVLSMIAGIYDEFTKLLYDYRNILEVEIMTASPIGNDEKQIIERTIESMLRKKIMPRYSVDANIIGGIIIKAGSTIYDGSINAYLNAIREHIIEGE